MAKKKKNKNNQSSQKKEMARSHSNIKLIHRIFALILAIALTVSLIAMYTL